MAGYAGIGTAWGSYVYYDTLKQWREDLEQAAREFRDTKCPEKITDHNKRPYDIITRPIALRIQSAGREYYVNGELGYLNVFYRAPSYAAECDIDDLPWLDTRLRMFANIDAVYCGLRWPMSHSRPMLDAQCGEPRGWLMW